MGTRNLTMVISQEQTKVAQYGQWDGYPDGQGLTVLNFIRACDLEKFKEKVNALCFYTDDEIEEIDKDVHWKEKYPNLSRDVAAEILEFIYNGDVTKLSNHEAFTGDSLFNEWTYVIDLDKSTFEVYKGFNKTPLSETDRFYKFFQHPDHGSEVYYPVKLVKTYSLNQLPSNEEFIEDFQEKEVD